MPTYDYYNKKKGSGSGKTKKEHIQSIFIPNIYEDSETLSYLDTQVFVVADYVFEIYDVI